MDRRFGHTPPEDAQLGTLLTETMAEQATHVAPTPDALVRLNAHLDAAQPARPWWAGRLRFAAAAAVALLVLALVTPIGRSAAAGLANAAQAVVTTVKQIATGESDTGTKTPAPITGTQHPATGSAVATSPTGSSTSLPGTRAAPGSATTGTAQPSGPAGTASLSTATPSVAATPPTATPAIASTPTPLATGFPGRLTATQEATATPRAPTNPPAATSTPTKPPTPTATPTSLASGTPSAGHDPVKLKAQEGEHPAPPAAHISDEEPKKTPEPPKGAKPHPAEATKRPGHGTGDD